MNGKKRILVIEDEQGLAQMIKMRLVPCGYEVELVFDGEMGLERAREWKPDLILLDVMLPNLDGWEICRLLKFDFDYKDIPIIILTARASKQDEETAKEARADAYMTKPFDAPVLMDKIRELLKEQKPGVVNG